MLAALSILAAAASALTGLTSLVFLMACGANSTPKQISDLKLMMAGVAIVTLAGIAAAVWLFIKARYGVAALIGIAPAAACIGLFTWMYITEY